MLARRSRYRTHGVCQTTALVVTLAMTAIWMVPAFHAIYSPQIFALGNRVNAAAAAHVVTGTAALLLGVYVVLVAGARIIPAALHFSNYKVWLRTAIVTWWLALLLGVLTYWLATS